MKSSRRHQAPPYCPQSFFLGCLFFPRQLLGVGLSLIPVHPLSSLSFSFYVPHIPHSGQNSNSFSSWVSKVSFPEHLIMEILPPIKAQPEHIQLKTSFSHIQNERTQIHVPLLNLALDPFLTVMQFITIHLHVMQPMAE